MDINEILAVIQDRVYLFYFFAAFIGITVIGIKLIARLTRVPTVLAIINTSKKDTARKSATKEQKKETFDETAVRVGWQVDKGYRFKCLCYALVVGAVIGIIMQNLLPILVMLAAGFYFPKYQLSKRADDYHAGLPIKAEAAIRAVEQQVDADIPLFDALKQAVPYFAEPLKSKYKLAIEKVEKTGMPLKDALAPIPVELSLSQLEYFHIILEVAQETEEKAKDVIVDASDMLKKQQEQTMRLNREVRTSRLEMKMMFWLNCTMVFIMFFAMPTDLFPIDPIVSIFVGAVAIFIAGSVTMFYLSKINARYMFNR